MFPLSAQAVVRFKGWCTWCEGDGPEVRPLCGPVLIPGLMASSPISKIGSAFSDQSLILPDAEWRVWVGAPWTLCGDGQGLAGLLQGLALKCFYVAGVRLGSGETASQLAPWEGPHTGASSAPSPGALEFSRQQRIRMKMGACDRENWI